MKRIEVGPMREPGAGVLVTTVGPRRVDWYQVKVGGGRIKRPISPLESLASCPVLRIAPPNCVVITRGPGTAGLPSEQAAEDEEAKRFDLLILKLQLSVLRSEPALLEEQASIPMVHQQQGRGSGSDTEGEGREPRPRTVRAVAGGVGPGRSQGSFRVIPRPCELRRPGRPAASQPSRHVAGRHHDRPVGYSQPGTDLVEWEIHVQRCPCVWTGIRDGQRPAARHPHTTSPQIV
jgi:hypothetical protein